MELKTKALLSESVLSSEGMIRVGTVTLTSVWSYSLFIGHFCRIIYCALYKNMCLSSQIEYF